MCLVARLLLIVVALDLLIGRVGLALGGGVPWLRLCALFLYHLAGLLALIVAALGVLGLLSDAARFPRVGRIVVAVTSAAFLPLAALALSGPLPGWLHAYVYGAFGIALLGLLVAVLFATAPWSARSGVICLAVAPLLYAFALFSSSLQLPASLAAFAESAGGFGRAAALLLGIPALMVVRPARPRGRALLIAVLATAGVALTLSARPALLDAAIGVPAPSSGASTALALLSMVLTVAALAAVRGATPRRRALFGGLALVLLQGVMLVSPGHLLVCFAAFALLVRGAALGAPDSRRWRDYLAAVASGVDAGEPVVIALRSEEVSRMRAEQGPVDLRLVRCADEIVQVDVAVGAPPRTVPALSATHRLAAQPRGSHLAEAAGTAHPCGEAEFDREFDVRGDGLLDLLDAETRRMLLALPPGALAVWSKEGARWRSFPARTSNPDRPVPLARIAGNADAAPVDDLVGVVRVLREVARRAGVM